PGAAAPEGDLPLPPLNPAGLEPLLDPAVPLPGLRPVGFDPLLEPGPVPGLALVAGGTLPGAMPGAAYAGDPQPPYAPRLYELVHAELISPFHFCNFLIAAQFIP